VVGGIDEESTRVGTLIYEEINDRGVIPVSDATTAEAVKVFEGLYRDVNIGLANELATLTDEMGIDVNEAIEVANTQPFCDIHDPGPGVGGHCIPFYPYFVINPFSTETPLLEMARSVNDSMPTFTVRKIREEFVAEGESLEGSSVLLLGLTYRPGVEEIRASPSIAIADELSSLGMDVYGVDPMLDTAAGFDLQLIELEEVYDQSWDAIISVTPHDEFESIQWESINREGGQLVVIDGRGTVEIGDADHRVYTIGSGWKS
jgi:UDP-N-acetyl-D-mannosaminuronic acid dehydrogenase